jgi:hypothetical protein
MRILRETSDLTDIVQRLGAANEAAGNSNFRSRVAAITAERHRCLQQEDCNRDD